MDRKVLYEKVEKALNQAFEATKQSAKVISEKAGEAAHLTKLHIEKATLEHKVSKKFAALGNKVFEQAVGGSKSISLDEPAIKALISETDQLEDELRKIESSIDSERRKKK